ncbi:TonB-dependent receptor domain-containing protein [Tsuneonella amylolytica]|uniref:TonB-dependent receptor domain-containing protein n=1 Tax=Tsuneonella amylolytica TaxID=2338327 RepID=UPI000EAAA7C9|nr:TonB-dependent receptor [Tsuneonella amylolytica]
MRTTRWVALSGVSLALLAMPVHAQQVLPQPVDDGVELEDPTAPIVGEPIVVTGSRIVRRDYTAESPITTVDEEFIQNAGPATLEQSLNALPQFQATQGSQTSAIAGGSGGRANANLRGLGSERTLILFDGRRLQPSDTSGAIDLNTVPSALISSVEVITGGASAVYGSDAIAGVVNFKFDNRFRGLELEGDVGISGMGDAATYSAAATYGGSLADDRARVFVSGSYLERDTASQNSRAFFDNQDGTSSPTSGLIIQSGSNPFGFGRASSVAAFRNLFTNTYGTAIPGVSSSYAVNSDGTIIGRDGGLNLRDTATTGYIVADGVVRQRSLSDSTVQLPIKRYTAFARGEFDVTSTITAYAQVNYATYKARQQSASGVLQSVVAPIQIPVSNPFITPDLRILLNARPIPTAPISYYFTGTRIGRLEVEEDYDVYQGLVGFRGSLGDNLQFDLYATHGRTRSDSTTFNQISRSRFNQVVSAPDGGASLCAGGYDPFGFARASQACSDYLTFDTVDTSIFEQTVVQGNLTGSLFALPAGTVGFAVGAEYRRNAYEARIDPRRSPTPTSVPGVTTSPEALGTSGAFSSGGDVSVAEIYGELLVPIFDGFEANLAYRYSDYDTIGGVHTYKAGANWTPLDGFTLRGGYSRAIRAPSLGNLYSPRAGAIGIIGRASAGGGDPCDVTGAARSGQVSGVDPARVRALCIAQGVPLALVDGYTYSGSANAAFRIGNPDLQEETADSYTIGAVLQPAFMSGVFDQFSSSIDYYNIKVDDAIGYLTSPIALNQCFNFSGQNPNYDPGNANCRLITRDASGLLAEIAEPLFNLASYQTSGIDFQLDASIRLGRGARVFLNSAVTYVIDYKIQSTASDPVFDYAGTVGNTQIDGFSSTHPAWKHVTTLGLASDTGSLSLRWRYIGEQENSTIVTDPATTATGVPAVSYFDLVGRLIVDDSFEFRAGVNNLFDKQPPEFGGRSVTPTSAYDVIGRRFFIGATARF